jgi:hypothetical protein
MAFQFVSSCHDRNHDRSRQVVMSSSHASYPDDWLAQQSLFMGSSTLLYRRQVSMSPRDSYPASSRYFSAPAVQGPMIDGVSLISGRSMYPTPTYNYGNPGFYYDPLQFPNCVASQTHNQVPQVAPYNVHQYACMSPPTPPVSHDIAFGDNGEFTSTPFSPYPNQCPNISDTPSFIPPLSVNHVGPSSPILGMNFEDHIPLSSNPGIPVREVGCQLTAPPTSPVMIKEAQKLTIPQVDPAKLSWSSFAMKLHASLIECDIGYLLRESSNNEANAAHSKELMLELFKKLQGIAINLFTGLTAQRYYLEGGRGIEMIKALVDKFHHMDERAIQTIISFMQSLTLVDTEDLSVYRDKLENYNLQLSWVGQEMSPSFLVYLAQSQLSKSLYQKDIESLQMSHTASGTSF